MYKLIRPLLFLGNAETMHTWACRLGRWCGISPFRTCVKSIYHFENKRLHVEAFGLSFKNPIGLAAGFDKNAEMTPVLSALGFGFLEIGTITPKEQEGNPKPRLFRIPRDKAMINRMGFNNCGADEARQHLTGVRMRGCILGINIGKNKMTPLLDAARDYVACFESLAPYADYLVVNVSSPNTPNLRELQDKKALRELLSIIQKENQNMERPKPILVKISPDLNDAKLNDIVEVCRASRVNGIIAANTSVSREGLSISQDALQALGEGGMSGLPLRDRANHVIRYLYKKLQGEIPIIGVGGVMNADDAYEKICGGATLVELYTGLIYEGPSIVKKIKKGLVRLLERDGFSSIQDAIGSRHAL